MESLAAATGSSSVDAGPQQNGVGPAQGGNGVGGNKANGQGKGPSPSMVLMDVVPRAKDILWRTRAMWATHDATLRAATAFNEMLETTYERLMPSHNDHSMRLRLLERLNSLIQPCAPGSQVVIFGSFETNVYTPTGDLDLSLVLPETGVVRYQQDHVEMRGGFLSKTQRVKILRIVRRVLMRAFNYSDNGARYPAFNQMDLIAGARVPVLNFVDVATRVKCDISINNDGALFKSRVLRWVLELDDRCRPLVCLVKAWARAQGINDSRNGTLNSYALSLLVVFHLQTRSPPILPSFQDVLKSNYHESRKGVNISEVRVTEEQLRVTHARVLALRGVMDSQPKNGNSLGELLASFFIQCANVESLWAHGLTASPWSATWKEARQAHTAWFGKQYIMRVEDPFDLSENCARSVTPGRIGFLKICAAFRTAANALQTPPTTAKTVDAHVAIFGHQMIPPRTSLRPNSAPRKVNAEAGPEEAAQWWGQNHVGHVGPPPQGQVSPRPPYRPPGLYGQWAPPAQKYVGGSGLNQGGFTAPFLANRSPQSHVMAMLEALQATPANSPGGLTPGPHFPPGFTPPREGSPSPSPAGRFPPQSIGGSLDSEGRPEVHFGEGSPSPNPPLLSRVPSAQSPSHPPPHFPARSYPPSPSVSNSPSRSQSQEPSGSHQSPATSPSVQQPPPKLNPNRLETPSNLSPLVQHFLEKPTDLTANNDSGTSGGQDEGAILPPPECPNHGPFPHVPPEPIFAERPPSEPVQPKTKPPPPGKSRYRPSPNSFPRRRPPIARPAEYMHELDEDRPIIPPTRSQTTSEPMHELNEDRPILPPTRGQKTGESQSGGEKAGFKSRFRVAPARQIVDARTSAVAQSQSRFQQQKRNEL